jgi:hypothetical protein
VIYYRAAQVRPDLDAPDAGKWRYIGGGGPVGHCADCPGHDTEDGAREHYAAYLLDNLRVRDDNPNANTQRRCEFEGCDTFTSGSVEVGRWIFRFDLCAEHRTREAAATLMPALAGDSWES